MTSVYSASATQLECYLVLLHPVEDQVLFLKDASGGYTLPHYPTPKQDFEQVATMLETAQRRFGVLSAVLRCLKTVDDTRRYFALELLDWVAFQPDAVWLKTADIVDHTQIPAEQREIVREWFVWQADTSPLRAAWMQRGWFKTVEAWLLDLADRLDMLPTSPVQQQRAWARSCTMRLKTHNSGLVFKAVPPSFSYEPVITRVLSLRYVGKLPEVLAVNVDKSWLLMREFQGIPLTESRNLEDWQKTLQVFAEVQMDISDSTHSLVALGVPDRNVDHLVAQIDRLMVDLPPQLDKDEIQSLRRAARDIRNLCYDLIDIDLPLSLTHGDLWSGNVFLQPNGTPLFYDWSDAAVSHPFFDIPTFLAEIERELPHIPNAKEQLLDAYLGVWAYYRPLPKLKKAYALAEVLSKLHMAIAYQQLIMPGVEEAIRWEIENVLPAYLRQLMAEMRLYTP